MTVAIIKRFWVIALVFFFGSGFFSSWFDGVEPTA
jgi:hypothetical protein